MADLIGRVSRHKPAINPLELPVHDSTTSYLHSPSPTLSSFTSTVRSHHLTSNSHQHQHQHHQDEFSSNPNAYPDLKGHKAKIKINQKLHHSPSTSSVDVELDEIANGRSRDILARGVLEVNMKKEISLRIDSRKRRRESDGYLQDGEHEDIASHTSPHPSHWPGKIYGAGNSSNILGSLKYGSKSGFSGGDKKRGNSSAGDGGDGTLTREVSSTSSAVDEMGVSTKVFV